MEDEDDYDDFGDELEEALDDEAPGHEPSLPTGPELTAVQASINDSAQIEQPSQPEREDSRDEKPPDPSIGPDAERARQMQELLQSFTEDQLDRFEAHKRSSLNKKNMRRLLQAVTGHNPNTAGAANTTILLCGVAKMFIGELIEEARMVAAEQNASGALLPRHVHEAFQRMEQESSLSSRGSKRRRRL